MSKSLVLLSANTSLVAEKTTLERGWFDRRIRCRKIVLLYIFIAKKPAFDMFLVRLFYQIAIIICKCGS